MNTTSINFLQGRWLNLPWLKSAKLASNVEKERVSFSRRVKSLVAPVIAASGYSVIYLLTGGPLFAAVAIFLVALKYWIPEFKKKPEVDPAMEVSPISNEVQTGPISKSAGEEMAFNRSALEDYQKVELI